MKRVLGAVEHPRRAHALAVGWEAFNRTELLGYALLLLGTLQYSGVVELPLVHAWLRRKGYAPI